MFGDPLDGGIGAFIIEKLYGVKQNDRTTKAQMLAELIGEAEKTIYAAIGDIDSPDLWSNDLVLDALDRQASLLSPKARSSESKNNAPIVFIVDRDEIPLNERMRALWQNQKIDIRCYADSLTQHYTVVDGVHVRSEERHERGNPRKVWVYHNSLFLGRRLNSHFQHLLEKTHPLSHI